MDDEKKLSEIEEIVPVEAPVETVPVPGVTDEAAPAFEEPAELPEPLLSDEDRERYTAEAYEIVSDAEKKIGSRLPGSDGERKFHEYMAEKLRAIGIRPVTEEFAVFPRASIGGIPYAGWIGMVLSALVYFALANEALWIGLGFVSLCALVWLICSVFLYKRWFDRFFPMKVSRNTYGELLPEDGEYDYTIMISGHTDTSWNWRHSEFGYRWKDDPMKGALWVYAKVGFGAVATIVLWLICIFMAVVYTAVLFDKGTDVDAASNLLAGLLGQPVAEAIPHNWAYNIINSAGFGVFLHILRYLPFVTALGGLFVARWNDNSEKNASKGAMDNATGIALSYEVIKYFKEHPEKMPKRCRIVDLNCGSEEAGLRGSMAFTREHRDDGMLKNVWNVNIDSIADKDYFEVVIKDDWQFTRFDRDLEQMFKDSFNELGIESKTGGCIHNPVGGCDSTPMTKAGVKSVTFAAQNPMLTFYYHTFRDRAERFEPETVGKGFEVCLSVIDKIAAFQEQNGFPGVKK